MLRIRSVQGAWYYNTHECGSLVADWYYAKKILRRLQLPGGLYRIEYYSGFNTDKTLDIERSFPMYYKPDLPPRHCLPSSAVKCGSLIRVIADTCSHRYEIGRVLHVVGVNKQECGVIENVYVREGTKILGPHDFVVLEFA